MISVVIPSKNRPKLVERAVRSALNQTFQRIEVVVVIDGPDDKTVQILRQINDRRLRVVGLEQSVGPQEARNIGVHVSQGPWVAFLDDDDEWLPTKLERQFEAAQTSRWPNPIVSCGLIVEVSEGDLTWPGRAPGNSETVSNYLFLRKNSEKGEIRLQTSTLMMPKALLMNVPWRKCPHDEWDLLLRASTIEGAGLAFAPEPLVIWHSDSGPERVSKRWTMTWRRSSDWFYSVRDQLGPRAYADALLFYLSQWSYLEQDWTAFFEILWKAVRYGRPTLFGILAHTSRWLVPPWLRHSVANLILATQYGKPYGRHSIEGDR